MTAPAPGPPAGPVPDPGTGISVRLAFFYGAVFALIGIHLPFWPVWLAAKGLGATEIGALIAAGVGVKVFFNPLIAHVADRRSIDVDFAAREKGVVDEGKGDVVDHVPGLAVPLAALGGPDDHVADVAALGDGPGIESRVLPRQPGRHQNALGDPAPFPEQRQTPGLAVDDDHPHHGVDALGQVALEQERSGRGVIA